MHNNYTFMVAKDGLVPRDQQTWTYPFRYIRDPENDLCLYDLRCEVDQSGVHHKNPYAAFNFEPSRVAVEMGAIMEVFCKNGSVYNDTGTPIPSINYTCGEDHQWDKPVPILPCTCKEI